MTDEQLFEFGKIILKNQPFSTLVGAELAALVPGRAEITLAVRPDLLQQHGYVHGGVLAYLADNALTFAAGSVFGDAITVEVKVNYVNPAKGFDRLRAVANVVDAGTMQAVCRCDVFGENADGKSVLCAAAQGTIRRVRQPAAPT